MRPFAFNTRRVSYSGILQPRRRTTCRWEPGRWGVEKQDGGRDLAERGGFDGRAACKILTQQELSCISMCGRNLGTTPNLSPDRRFLTCAPLKPTPNRHQSSFKQAPSESLSRRPPLAKRARPARESLDDSLAAQRGHMVGAGKVPAATGPLSSQRKTRDSPTLRVPQLLSPPEPSYHLPVMGVHDGSPHGAVMSVDPPSQT